VSKTLSKEDRDALILRLWAEGKTTDQIGGLLGVTRNVVVGIVYRARANGTDVDPHGYHHKFNGGGVLTRRRKGAKRPQPRTETEANMAAIPAEPKPDYRRKIKPPTSLPEVPVIDAGDSGENLDRSAAARLELTKPNVRIWRLQPNGCKYATGVSKKGEHLFCNALTNGRSYCDEHHALCHTPTQPIKIRKIIPSWLR
jgi:hypothetical protein